MSINNWIEPLEGETTEVYFCRVEIPLVETLQKCRNLFVVTVSPKDKVLEKHTFLKLDKELIKLISNFTFVNYIFYPEVGENGRYHYHGLVWIDELEDEESNIQASESLDLTFHYLNKCIGNTLYQRIESFSQDYKTFNKKTRREEFTNFKKILKYITKSVNDKNLLRRLNNLIIFDRKLLKGRAMDSALPKTHVLCNLKKYIIEFYNENNILI